MRLEQSHRLCCEFFAEHAVARKGSPSLWRFACILYLLVSLTAAAQEVDIAPHVIKLQRQGLETKSGSSWCVDAGCSLLATNYHLAKDGLPGKIGGVKVLDIYLASAPDDEGAVWTMSPYGRWLRYNPLNDVALIALSEPLFPGSPAPSFYAGALVSGQELVVNGFPSGGTQEAVPGKFQGVVGGLLELSLATETGVSDGVVTDKQGRIVGMLSAVTDGRAFAVPLWSIADAIRKFRPALHSQLFPDGLRKPPELQGSMVSSRELLAALSGASPEAALPLASLEDGLGQPFPELVAHPVRLLTTREEPADILKLRRHAKRMVQQMANFRALQTLRLNSVGQPELVWFHELYVDSGHLVFRSVDDGQVMQALPWPPRHLALIPGGEWRELPRMVGSELKLRVEEIGSKDVGGKRFRVFRYQASVEDRVCWVNFHTGATHIHSRAKGTAVSVSHDHRLPVACRGEVWTDAELNPLRISRELEIPAGTVPMRLVQLAVLYGWLGHDLVPVEMTVRGIVAGHACRSDAHFSNYRPGNR